MTCVLDASVAIKAALSDDRESLSGAARSIRPHLAERFSLRAPSLIAWEVANVVHAKHPDAFGETVDQRQDVVAWILRDLDLDRPHDASTRRTGQLAEEETLTAYDAAYLELAERSDGLLVTEDRRLLEAGRSRLSLDRCLDTAGAFHHIQDGVL